MRRLYEKNQMRHFYVWLAIFLVVNIVAVNIGVNLGVSMHTAAVIPLGTLTLIMVIHLVRSGIATQIGLGRQSKVPAFRMWFYLPLWMLAFIPLTQGVRTDLTILLVITILGHFIAIGVLEEILFRGLLLKALLDQDKPVRAVVISSLTFGAGHAVSLLIGQGLTDTGLQIINATLVGFIFTMIVYLTGSLHAVIAAHILYNIMATVSVVTDGNLLILAGAGIVVVYGSWLLHLAGALQGRRQSAPAPAPAVHL